MSFLAEKVWKNGRIVIELDEDEKASIAEVDNRATKDGAVTLEDINKKLDIIINILTA